ncbi:MAG: GntR family transcriptional regulator [Casimicrobiaceae bacterium]
MAGPASSGAFLDRASALPLWAQLHADLRRRIGAVEFRNAFPGEMALATEYGVSRQTVREALRRLRAEGLVTAERGRPPRVAAPAEILQPLGALYSLFSSVESAGLKQRSVVRVLDSRVDAIVAERLGLKASTLLIHVERLRLADEQPLAVDRVWLPARLASALLQADLSQTALYGELERRCGIRLSDGRETIRAVAPGAAEQRLLKMPRGTAAFRIDRLGCVDGVPVEWRQTLVRGDKFAVLAEFSARAGYRLDIGAGALSDTPPAAQPRRSKRTQRA